MTCDECNLNKSLLDALWRDYYSLKQTSIDSFNQIKDMYEKAVERYKKTGVQYNDLLDKYNELVEKHNSSIDNNKNLMNDNRERYNKLVNDYNELLGKNKKNIEDHNELVNRFNDLSKSSSEKYINLQGKYNSLYNEKKELKEECDNLDIEYNASKEKVELTMIELEKTKDLFGNLQIVVNNKYHELDKKERKIKELKELLGKSREEIIDYKLKAKESKLETLIQKLEIDRKQIRELQKFYQQLIRARLNDNQDEIDTADEKIETIKDELIEERGIDIIDAQKLCHKCESIAKLRVEQDKLYQERFETKQEIVVYNKR